MEDFNNIEFDPIPEGLEFNESYMQDAFALYDAEKQKRKRRLLIWWFTSALGFSCVLLVGIFWFTKNSTTDTAGNSKTHREKTASAQHSQDEKHHAASVIRSQDEPSSTAVRQRARSSSESSATHFDGKRGSASQASGSLHSSIQHQNRFAYKRATGSGENNHPRKNLVSGISTGVLRKDEQAEGKDHSGNAASPAAISVTPKETAKIDFDFSVNPGALPAKSAIIAFDNDSRISSITVIDSLHDAASPENPVRKHQLFMNLGVNTLFGMKELQHRVIFKESIGLSYQYRLSQKIGIGIGLEYHSLPRISYRRIISDTTKSDKTTILNKTTLNYISLFPQMSYQLGSRQQLTAGLGIEYLLTDPGERYEIKTYTDETPKRANSKLYYSTFNRFNFSVSIGYVYQFSRFMSVQAQYHYGFTDITKNSKFNQTFDRNSRLQIGLRIKLL